MLVKVDASSIQRRFFGEVARDGAGARSAQAAPPAVHSLAASIRQCIHRSPRQSIGALALLALGCPVAASHAQGFAVPVVPSFELSDLDDPDRRNGFVIRAFGGFDPEAIGDELGFSVSNAGDVNGDGLDDVIIGARGARDDVGDSYVVFGKEADFDAEIDVASLSVEDGFVIRGVDSRPGLGSSVSSAGDVNGDGVDDLIIAGQRESYVVFGKAELGGEFDLSSLDGANGFVFDDGYVGSTVVSGGSDINGDGFDDLIIGRPFSIPDVDGDGIVDGVVETGQSYVVFGDAEFGAELRLGDLNGSNGFVINSGGALVEERLGSSVSSAGDVNGDGLDDLIIGASSASPDSDRQHAGESYVVFGKRTDFFGHELRLSSLNGSNGFVISGIKAGDSLGSSVSGAGDVNGDGFDDLIIGAPGADPTYRNGAGESYVVFGNAEFGDRLELYSLNGNNGFVISGIYAGDGSGSSVSSAGDVNGDGFDDLIIGAPDHSRPGGLIAVGESYVVFGKSAGFDRELELSALDGSNGFGIRGIDDHDRLGFSVSSAGDVNGDGVDDLIIGAPIDSNVVDAGQSYVVFMPMQDSFEPDNSETSAKGLANGAIQLHSIAPAGDKDNYTFTIDRVPQDVFIQTTTAGTQTLDTKMTLTWQFGTFFADDPEFCSTGPAEIVSVDSRMFVRNLPCGTYNLRVEAAEPDQAIPGYAISRNDKLVTTLPANTWRLLSLPGFNSDPSSMTVEAVFGDALNPDTHASQGPADTGWSLFTYDPIAGSYRLPELSESLQPGQAFWIIQHTGEPVTLNLPESFASVTADRQDPSGPCVNGCFELDLPASSGNPTQWNMIGLPSDKSVSTASMRVDDGDGGCPVIFSNDPFDQSAPPAVSYDCTLATARARNVMSDQFFRYNGTQYEVVGSAGSANRWHPWDGFWSAVLSGGTSPIQIVIPAP